MRHHFLRGANRSRTSAIPLLNCVGAFGLNFCNRSQLSAESAKPNLLTMLSFNEWWNTIRTRGSSSWFAAVGDNVIHWQTENLRHLRYHLVFRQTLLSRPMIDTANILSLKGCFKVDECRAPHFKARKDDAVPVRSSKGHEFWCFHKSTRKILSVAQRMPIDCQKQSAKSKNLIRKIAKSSVALAVLKQILSP